MRHVLILAIAVTAACSPAQHRAYQYTMGGAALAGWGTGAVITEREMQRPDSPYRETNVMLGVHPGTLRLAGAGLVNLAVVVGIRLIPDRAFDGTTPWAKDALMTAAAVMGVADGYGDYRLTH